MKFVANAALITAFLAAGLLLGPQLRAGLDRLFPDSHYVTGDYEALYQASGETVVMFSTSTCTYCKRAREVLQRENVEFTDFVIDQAPDAKRRFEALGGGGVPQLFIGGRRITGFREKTILESLSLIGQPPETAAPGKL